MSRCRAVAYVRVGSDSPATADPADGADGVHRCRDGSSFRVRPMSPDDADGLERFHEALSRDTIRLRFFGLHPHLSRDEIERFTNVDHADREAVVALAGDEIIGVGRYERLANGSDAEVAFVVTDLWQGRGVGAVLFRQVAERARNAGISRFVAETAIENRRMLDVFGHSGLPTTKTFDQGVVSLTMTLRSDPDGPPLTPA